jgi:hypothetical protein
MTRHGKIQEEPFATRAGEKGAGRRRRSIRLEARLKGARLPGWATKMPVGVMLNAAAMHSGHKPMLEGLISDAEVNSKERTRGGPESKPIRCRKIFRKGCKS